MRILTHENFFILYKVIRLLLGNVLLGNFIFCAFSILKSLNRGIQNQDRLKFLKLESLALLGSAVRVIVLESLYVLLF